MKLKELRKKKNLTQEQVAKYLNISQRTYSGYELGKSEPTIETLKKLADFFSTTIDYIVDRDTDIINLNGLEYKKAKLMRDILQMSERKFELIQSYSDGLNQK